MKLTKFAIAVVVVLAMSAVVASGASAKKLISNAGVNTASLEGVDTGNMKLTIDGQNTTCNETKFTTGNLNLPANEVTMNAVYTGCTSFGFSGATVNMGNCHYKLTTPNKLATDEYTAVFDIVCKDTANSANNVININSSTFGSECSVSIGEKTGTEHVIIKNTTNNAPKDLSLSFTVTNMTVTKNKDNGLCPLSGTGTANNASYNGELTLKDINGKDIFLEN